MKSEGAGRAANWVVIVVLPLFVGIFLASYLCQWTPFYDHVMVPFQEAFVFSFFFFIVIVYVFILIGVNELLFMIMLWFHFHLFI